MRSKRFVADEIFIDVKVWGSATGTVYYEMGEIGSEFDSIDVDSLRFVSVESPESEEVPVQLSTDDIAKVCNELEYFFRYLLTIDEPVDVFHVDPILIDGAVA